MALSLLNLRNSTNNNRVTINAISVYANIAKGFGFAAQDPTIVNSDGYWTTAPASTVFGNAPLPKNYYGKYVWKCGGNASLQWSPAAIIYSGAQFVSSSGNVGGAGTTTSNTTITATLCAANGGSPRVVLKFGALISSVSGGSGSLVTITLAYAVSSTFPTGSTVSFAQGVSANLVNGPNADGSWTITNTGTTSFTLNNSTGVVSPTVTGTGSVGVQSEAIVGNFSTNAAVLTGSSGAFSNFSALVFCTLANETAVDAGQIIDPTYLSQLIYLFNQTGSSNSSKGWLRMMDVTGVQGSFECDFSQRIPSTYIRYSSSNYRPGYWTPSTSGAITNGGSDDYTCADPSVSVWDGSAYIDNAIVQGIPSATNTGGTPTLAVGGHAAKPIYANQDGVPPFILKLTAGASSPGTDVLQYTFQATWLNSNTPYVFNYTTVAGDGTLATLNANLATKLGADTTLAAAKIFIANPQNGVGPFVYPRTAQAGRLSVTYSSGPAISQVWNMKTSAITAASGGTFVYNYLLDGWVYRAGAMVTSIPLEAIVDMCNRAGAHCWFNWGHTKAQYITDVTNFFGDSVTGLTSGLRLGNEAWNEVWNSSAFPFSLLQTFGNALGWGDSSFVSNFSYTSLRTIQYAALGKAAWTGKGRSASDYYVLQLTQESNLGLNGNFDGSSLKGTQLNASGTIYGTYGGLNGGVASSYNVAPNRPVDITNTIGFAPYWNSHWLGSGSFTTAANFKGTATQNADLLTAAKNFANGSVSTAFTSLVNEFNGTTTKSGGATSGTDFAGQQTLFTQLETLCANYDGASRVAAGLPALGVMHYEGGPSFGSGTDGNNGVNSLTFNTVASGDITTLASRFTTLDSPVGSFDCSPYTISTTDDKTEMATMVLQMLQAWKFDVDNTGVDANTGSYKNMIKTWYYQALKTTSGSNRETKPAQYGYAASNWGVWPVSIYDTNSYKNYDAIHEWNAGG